MQPPHCQAKGIFRAQPSPHHHHGTAAAQMTAAMPQPPPTNWPGQGSSFSLSWCARGGSTHCRPPAALQRPRRCSAHGVGLQHTVPSCSCNPSTCTRLKLTQLTRLRLQTPEWLPAATIWGAALPDCAALSALPALQHMELNREALEQALTSCCPDPILSAPHPGADMACTPRPTSLTAPAHSLNV
jgi:hypothetical protein